MEEFTDIDSMSLNDLSDTVLKNFGDRYAGEATRLLNTGIMLPEDSHMIQLALAITMGMYMKKLVDNEFDEKDTVH